MSEARLPPGLTADLVENLAPDAVAVLGDNQYEHGELDELQRRSRPHLGALQVESRTRRWATTNTRAIRNETRRPATTTYFGAAAGDPAEGYYRWELGWLDVFVLNSGAINYTRDTGRNPSLPDDCWPVSCAAGSEQEQWLRAELEALPDDACVLAYWHHPRFSSGFSGANQPHPETGPLFTGLYEHGAELLLTGHSHNYERFEPVTPAERADPAGVTQFVVGTGGRGLHTDTGPRRETSAQLAQTCSACRS